ncbi:tetratricopeptide repeat protein [Gillisia sp. JM1]|uniref:tetratricopeptide repeat protein n=1 Tax=Gillisia sp. JM1 TaxID=1283286 RepID=UPI000412534D|nr:tetratricopeptide repeat protein [Gillisia sp. JM1]
MNKILLILFFITVSACVNKAETSKNLAVNTENNLKIGKEEQEDIIDKYLKNGAWKHESYSREYQEEINKGLAKDSTIAYLWQQKAMPLFKQGKYEIGMEFIDKAVKYDRRKWQEYRAFMKCIFAKDYRDAIADFQDYKKKYGYGYVMDHSYDFYIGLSYLQLNEFKKAEDIFQKDYDRTLNEKDKDWLHHLDLFYYGISRYEQKDYEGAIEMFDKALIIYPQFSDVLCYKAESLRRLGKVKEGDELTKDCKLFAEKGFTINEDNVKYEKYPYQIRWY